MHGAPRAQGALASAPLLAPTQVTRARLDPSLVMVRASGQPRSAASRRRAIATRPELARASRLGDADDRRPMPIEPQTNALEEPGHTSSRLYQLLSRPGGVCTRAPGRKRLRLRGVGARATRQPAAERLEQAADRVFAWARARSDPGISFGCFTDPCGALPGSLATRASQHGLRLGAPVIATGHLSGAGAGEARSAGGGAIYRLALALARMHALYLGKTAAHSRMVWGPQPR